jgi:hypothetical protein
MDDQTRWADALIQAEERLNGSPSAVKVAHIMDVAKILEAGEPLAGGWVQVQDADHPWLRKGSGVEASHLRKLVADLGGACSSRTTPDGTVWVFKRWLGRAA